MGLKEGKWVKNLGNKPLRTSTIFTNAPETQGIENQNIASSLNTKIQGADGVPRFTSDLSEGKVT